MQFVVGAKAQDNPYQALAQSQIQAIPNNYEIVDESKYQQASDVQMNQQAVFAPLPAHDQNGQRQEQYSVSNPIMTTANVQQLDAGHVLQNVQEPQLNNYQANDQTVPNGGQMPSAQRLVPLPLATTPNDKIGRLPDQAGDPDQ